MNNIELNPGDCIEITYTLCFHNSRPEKTIVDLDKLKETLVKYTKRYKKLYTKVKINE